MTTVMIVHSTCGSRVYIGMYIHDCMIVNVVFTITNNLKQIVPSYAYYLILKLSITASLCCSRVYIGMYIHDCMTSECSDNKSFYYN